MSRKLSLELSKSVLDPNIIWFGCHLWEVGSLFYLVLVGLINFHLIFLKVFPFGCVEINKERIFCNIVDSCYYLLKIDLFDSNVGYNHSG